MGEAGSRCGFPPSVQTSREPRKCFPSSTAVSVGCQANPPLQTQHTDGPPVSIGTRHRSSLCNRTQPQTLGLGLAWLSCSLSSSGSTSDAPPRYTPTCSPSLSPSLTPSSLHFHFLAASLDRRSLSPLPTLAASLQHSFPPARRPLLQPACSLESPQFGDRGGADIRGEVVRA